MIENLRHPFKFLGLKHPELRLYKIIAIAAAALWAMTDFAHFLIAGNTVNFFHANGVLDRLIPTLSVMVGVYFGLAGVFAASTTEWLSAPMPGGVPDTDSGGAMTRRAFFMSLLAYCAAGSTLVVFSSSLLPPLSIPLFDLAIRSLPPAVSAEARVFIRVIASVAASSVVILACIHLLISSILSTRFLSKSG